MAGQVIPSQDVESSTLLGSLLLDALKPVQNAHFISPSIQLVSHLSLS